jgi:hypothetical protein
MRTKDKKYVGIHNDVNAGMTDTGKIIRDAWVFDLIPETETCEGWLAQGIEDLWQKVNAQWEQYGFLVGNLPDDLKQKYIRIQQDAIERAKAAGWNPDNELAGDED